MSQQRIELAKCISFVYVIDDIFDGTVEELTLFTQVVNRWELCAMMDLPEYMRSTYKVLYNTINSIGYNIYKIYGRNPTQNLRNTWANLCNAFLKEAKWFASGVLPTADVYLKNGLDENQEGNDGSYIECYMKGQKNGSIGLAREYVVKQIEDEWKQVNKKHFDLMNGSLGSFSKASLNLVRMVPLMYNYDDKQSLHVLLEGCLQ
ncbi:hypothetical protein H5410_049402 [Solanum commersonii]|uniref:Terpene synthase metal-binding domain-containing protein n=1 Tax=Solanum commersonii TaxID=4109 RepID=A0A9J5WU01_SOLCO|nr:hypothetical protein H5410_049402 [Solanum commersonii]